MKNIAFTVLILCLFSCNYQEKKQIEQNRIDSIALAENRSIEVANSIKRALLKEQSLIAWGDAKFGMSPQDVLKTKAFEGAGEYIKGTRLNDGSMSRSYISMPFDKKVQFTEDLEFSVQEFDAHFKSEELYLISIRTHSKSARYIDYMIKDANTLSSKFSDRYGSPTYSKNDVSIFDFESGQQFVYKRWEIEDKTISIYFGEEKYESCYYYEIIIRNRKFPTKEDVEEIKNKQEQNQKKKEREKYQF